MVFKQDIGILMGFNPALFLGKPVSIFFFFFFFFEPNHVRICHASIRFIDDLCSTNDDDEFSESFKCIYPGELGLKLEQSGIHTTFLHLDIKIENGIFVYKFFDKRDKFPLFIVPMAHFRSNIPSTIYCGSIFS